MQTAYYIILVPMVYAAFAVFLLGTTIRLVKLYLQPSPGTAPIYPNQRRGWLWAMHDTFLLPTVRKHNPGLWVLLMFFHVAFLLLIIGHLELIKDFRVFQIVPHAVFLGRGVIGLILSIALLLFLFRRFASPNRDLSVPEDYYLLILLFLVVCFGSQMDWARSWFDYSEMAVSDYRTYLWSLLTLKPSLPTSVLFSGHSFMFILHVFFANIFLMFFPFSKIMHSFMALPMNKLRRG